MGFLDKLLGRGKQADSSPKSEGAHQGQKGMAEKRAEPADEVAQEAEKEAES